MEWRHCFYPGANKKKGKKMIRHAVSSDSGYQASLSTYSWSHTAADVNDPKQLYGLVVSLAIFSSSVTGISVTATTGGVTRNLTFAHGITKNNIRAEVWHIPDLSPSAYTIEVTLSGVTNSSAGASTYGRLGSIGATNSFSGTGTGGSIGLPLLLEHSIIYVTFISAALSGIIDTGIAQNRRVTVESASGSHVVSDIGPVSPLPEEAEISFDGGAVSDDFAIISIELLNNNVQAPPIG
ncbi:MAG TPA: hypothetical protein VI755_11540 [Anaerolineales bacterium]|nr:hypothetical protein [Anaerolineales bacterium]